MSEIKNSPIEDFDWEAFERGETAGDKTREELTKTYDESLNTVKDKEVTEGTVISINNFNLMQLFLLVHIEQKY